MKNQWLIIKQLDEQLHAWQTVYRRYGIPRLGWLKTIRLALNMTAQQFANRLGFTRARVNQLESAELNDSVTLRSMKEAANALNCEFIYAIVPKGHLSVEMIIKERAEEVADEQIKRIAHTMSLESQAVDNQMLAAQKKELIKTLTENMNKKFWADNKPKGITNLRDQLLKMKKK